MKNLVQLIHSSLKAYVPQLVKDFAMKPFRSQIQKDIERFKKNGTRFTPYLPDFPPMVMIDTTTRCNLACAHCPNSNLSKDADFLGDMDTELYFKIIDEIAMAAPNTLVRPFDGGEPLMRRDIAALIGYAKMKGIRRTSINTNATLLSKPRRTELIENGLDHIEVSIDAATPETYFKIRRSPLFKKVLENALAYIEESKSYNPNSRVTVSFVLQRDNRHEYEAFKQFWNGKADEVNIRRYHQHHSLVDNHGHFQKRNYKFRHPCPYLWDRIIIYHDGRVRFCESDWKAEHAIGDIRNQRIKEIWHGQVYRELRQQHIKGIFKHPFCKSCVDWREVKWPGM